MCCALSVNNSKVGISNQYPSESLSYLLSDLSGLFCETLSFGLILCD
jgi:hypothetical protein